MNKNIIIGLIIGLLLGAFLNAGMIFWLILGAIFMYIAIKNQLIR